MHTYFCLILIVSSLISQRAGLGRPNLLETFQAECQLCLRVQQGAAARQWQPMTLALTVTTPLANPYDHLTAAVYAEWDAPSGSRVRVPAFFMAGVAGGWRVRFTPTERGRWRVSAVIVGTRLRGPARVVDVGAAAADATGFVRVHPRNRNMLAFDTGRSYFPIGANIAWYTNDAQIEYKRRFAALAANGGTVARVWLAPWSFGVEWKETPLGTYTNRELQMSQFDAVLALAEAYNIRLIVVLLEPGMFNPAERWRDNPYNAANGGPCAAPRDFLTDPRARAAYRNQLHYIAARWGYSPNILAWEWMNEVNSAPGFETESLLPWLREMTTALREADVNTHLLTISYAAVDGDPRVWTLPEIDLVQRHEYAQGDPKWFAPTLDRAGAPLRFKQVRELGDKPLIVAEFGANNQIEKPEGAYREGIHLHNGLWAAAFSGMAGASMYWWWDNYLEPGNLWPRYRGLAAFLQNEDLARFAPGLVHAQASGLTRATAMLLAHKNSGGTTDRALLWVRNRAWSHDDALVRYTLEASSGAATAENFRFEPRPAQEVRITVPGLAAGAYQLSTIDTTAGAVLRVQQVRVMTSTLVIQIDALPRDAAYTIQFMEMR